MTEPGRTSTAPLETPFEPLRWIGTYKIFKGVLALIGGILLLRLMHRNLPEIAEHLMERLQIQPQSALGHVILHRVLLIKNRSIGLLAAALFAYVPLTCAEGIGLMLRKLWAEWLTVVTTAALIPVEAREILLRANWIRVSLLLANIAVLIYLIIRIRRDRHRHKSWPSVMQTLPDAPAIPAPEAGAGSAQNKAPPKSSPRSNVPG